MPQRKCLRGADTLQFDSRQISPEAATGACSTASAETCAICPRLVEVGHGNTICKVAAKKTAIIRCNYALQSPTHHQRYSLFPEPIPDYIISYSNMTIEKRRRIVIPLSPETDNAQPPLL